MGIFADVRDPRVLPLLDYLGHLNAFDLYHVLDVCSTARTALVFGSQLDDSQVLTLRNVRRNSILESLPRFIIGQNLGPDGLRSSLLFSYDGIGCGSDISCDLVFLSHVDDSDVLDVCAYREVISLSWLEVVESHAPHCDVQEMSSRMIPGIHLSLLSVHR